MPTEKYRVKFNLLGGAEVTKIILASSEQDAGKRARRSFHATRIISIEKVK